MCLDDLQFTLNHALKYLHVSLHIGEVAKDETHHVSLTLTTGSNFGTKRKYSNFYGQKEKIKWSTVLSMPSPFFGPQQ